MNSKQTLRSIALAACLLVGLSASAYDFKVDGVCYNVRSDNVSVEVTCDRDKSSSSATLMYPSIKSIVIPEYVTFNSIPYPVTSIGKSAFTSYCYIYNGSVTDYPKSDSLVSIILPSTLTRIEESAFWARKLPSISFPNSLTYIGKYAFHHACLKTIDFGNSLQSIDEYAFMDCDSLRGINLPNSMHSIAGSAFSGCKNLASVDLGTGILSIGPSAFSDSKLQELAIPASVRKIDKNAFAIKKLMTVYCYITDPENVTVDSDAFGPEKVNGSDYRDGLMKIYVPKGCGLKYSTIRPWNRYVIEEMTIVAESLTLSPKELVLNEEQSDIISAIITPSNVDNRTLFWKSTNPLVVAVDENGKVTGIKPGVAQVIATTMDGSNLSDTCMVTVVTGKAQSITVSPTSAQLEIGGMTRLTATIMPEDVPNKTVQWTSSNEEIAMVSSTGMVYAVGPGSVTITASTTDGSNLSATCQVTVDAPFSLSTQSVAVPVNTKRNIPIIVDNHVDVKSFKFTVHVPDSIEFFSDALPGPRCSDFNVTTTFNADSTVVTVEGVMTVQPLVAGTGAFVLLPIKSSKYIADFDARLTDITFTATNDNVGTQQLPDITVTLRVLNLGDVNGDKVVDVSDINALINYMLGKPITGTFNFDLGDLDENGIIDISDINSVINLMLGKY